MRRFILRPDNADIKVNCLDFIRRLTVMAPGVEVVIKPYKAKRSDRQNNMYWAWMTEIANQYNQRKKPDQHPANKDLMHAVFSKKFLRIMGVEIMGMEVFDKFSTTMLSPSEFAEYITRIEVDCFENGYTISSPREL